MRDNLGRFIKGHHRKHTDEEKRKIGLKSKGRKHSIESIKKNSDSHKGKIPWNKGLKGFLKGRKVTWGYKISKSKKGIPCPKISESKKGEKSYLWKGGITPINKQIRNSYEYKLWRKAVFERDDYTCVWCGIKSGNGKTVYLEADHIKPFSLYPELRFAIDNGRTLCKECHKKTETYGIKLIINTAMFGKALKK